SDSGPVSQYGSVGQMDIQADGYAGHAVYEQIVDWLQEEDVQLKPPSPEFESDASQGQVTMRWDQRSDWTYNVFVSRDADCDVRNYTSCTEGRMMADVVSGVTIGDLDRDVDYYVVLEAKDEQGNAWLQDAKKIRLDAAHGDDDETDRSTHFFGTEDTYAHDFSRADACVAEFGQDARVADWYEVVAYYEDGNSMTEFFQDARLNSEYGRSLAVLRDGEQYFSSSRTYFISRHDGDVPGTYLVHDEIGGNLISLGSWHNDRRVLCVVDGDGAMAGPAKRLNDTGIDWCVDGDTNNLACPVAGYPGQDGDFGRDAAARDGNLEKVGDGAAGFDFTKLDANGNSLPASATEWSCVRDNVTGLIWEVKTTDGGLRDRDNTYSWYQPDGPNMGNPGTQNGGNCVGSNCDTHGFVQVVNDQGLCGANDWRLPTRDELRSIAHQGRTNPAIDEAYFPNTRSSHFWSASPSAGGSDRAWFVNFDFGRDYWHFKSFTNRVRLVRGGQ
ncbi:DUF1566 domain-containing protein, partial [Ectothiorhodospira variabilis]|uniref:Lcl C-terminal domain-containing protein n=1 Tax=Ectothiorhodospira variabilis TaxID=505694 RepID=UPI001EFB7D26